MSARLHKGIARRPVRRVKQGMEAPGPEPDEVVVEEPLEIRIAGEGMSVTMRTPGEDHALAVGFLFAEGLIGSIDDVGGVTHCGRPGTEEYGNVIDVTPAPGVVLDPERTAHTRRGTLTTAACGVCGRQSIDDLLARCSPVGDGPAVALRTVMGCTDRLRQAQRNFERTGGIHAAGVLSASGRMLAVMEDVGRHNAVDKAVGTLLYARSLGSGSSPSAEERPALLVVSGRPSFEMVQKAAVAQVPVVAGVSAPTSLAVDLAERTGITLAGFVRGERVNLYTHPERVEGKP